MKLEWSNQLSQSVGWWAQLPGWLDQQMFCLLAQAEAVAPAQAADAPAVNPFLQFFSNPINLILISAILFMFIVARPQQRQAKEHQRALADMKKNDRVVTASGIHGVVVQTSPEDPLVTIRIDENSGARMTINRDSVAKIIPSDSKE